MIHIGPAQPDLPADLAHHPGGMAWWYVDLVDDQGNGAVCLWPFGLPFLPGVASAERAGRPAVPAHRPAWNLAVYRDGRPDFYLLEEPRPEDCAWEPGTWTLGGFSACVEVAGDRVRLRVDIDSALAREDTAVQARLSVDGPLCQVEGARRRPTTPGSR